MSTNNDPMRALARLAPPAPGGDAVRRWRISYDSEMLVEQADDGDWVLFNDLAAAPAPAVEREACRHCFGVGNFDTRGAPACPDCDGTGRTPPAEAREPVGVTEAMVEAGARALWDAHGFVGDFTGSQLHRPRLEKLARTVLTAALAQPRDTPRDSGDACKHAPITVDWKFDGYTRTTTCCLLCGANLPNPPAIQSPTGEPSNG